jgi:Neprosin
MPEYTPSQLRNKADCEAYVADHLSRLDIVATTTTPSGQTVDWIPHQVADGLPPPLPQHADESLHDGDSHSDMPKTFVAQGELEMDGVERGPPGTVPTHRMNFEKATFERSLHQVLSSKVAPLTDANIPAAGPVADENGTHWYASTSQKVDNYGGCASFSIFVPTVERPADFSLIQVAVIRDHGAADSNPTGRQEQTVEAGWIFAPSFLGPEPVVFSFFTTKGYVDFGRNAGADAFKQGYNTAPGWRINPYIVPTIQPGTRLNPKSIDGGAQYDVKIQYTLVNDQWWLGINDQWLGSYPAELFSRNRPDATKTLADHADRINFYGEVFDFKKNPKMTTTDMGSGMFSGSGFSHSAYIRNIQYQPQSSNIDASLVDYKGVVETGSVSDPRRYDLITAFPSGTSWGSFMYVGGPGAPGFDWTGVNDNWRRIGGVFPWKAPVTAISRNPNIIDLFVCGSDKKVYTSWRPRGGDWYGINSGWRPIGGLFPPGNKVTAVAMTPDNLDLFIVGFDGNVYTSRWDQLHDWSGVNDNWDNLGGTVFPDSEVAAVARQGSLMDIIVYNEGLIVWTRSWSQPAGWSPWLALGTTPRFFAGPVTAVSRKPDIIDIFICGLDGTVYTSWWTDADAAWHANTNDWESIGSGPFAALTKPTRLAAVARSPNNLDVFVCGTDGEVYTTYWVDGRTWANVTTDWRKIGGLFPPSCPVTAVARKPTNLDLFVCAYDQRVHTSSWEDGSDWTGLGVNKWRAIGGFFDDSKEVGAVASDSYNVALVIMGGNGNVYESEALFIPFP